MLFQSSLRARRAASLLSTLSLVAYGSALLTPVRAQTPVDNKNGRNDRSETPEKSKQDELGKKKKEVTPAPGNPAVLVDPTTGAGNNTKDYNKDGTRRIKPETRYDYGDHKRNPNDPRAISDPQDLPIYGYSYFEPARQIIEARRNGLRRMLGGVSDSKSTTRRSSSTRGSLSNSDRASSRSKTPRDKNMGDDGTNDDGYDTSDTGNSKTRRRVDNQDDTRDPTDRTTRRRVNRDDNTDTSSDDQTDDNTPTRRVRRGSNGDTSRDDNTDDTPTRRRVNRDDNTDTSSDDETDADNRRQARRSDEDSNDQATRDADLREQRRRQLAGLPPLDTTRKTTRKRTSDDYGDDTYGDTSRSSRSSRQSTRDDELDYNSSSYTSNGSGTNNDRRQPNAYNQIVDPLTQLTSNIIASAPTNYQLSGGDEVVIHISTPKLPPRDLTRTVDATGFLDLEDMGRFVVRGKTLDQVQKDLTTRLNRFYKNADVSLSLKQLRTIPVTVQGEAVLPGSYNVPAVVSAFNMLYVAGGPTEDGSLREIKVMRQGKEVGTLDFYKFIAGQNQTDIPLQAGDVIVVPPNGARVALSGEVRHPALYEIKPNETLKDVFAYAGGIKASGVDQIVQLNTIEPGQNRVLKNVNLRDQSQVASAHLYDGDTVEIHSVRQVVDNKVTIKGAVTQPSDYALTPGMRVGDLLRMARNPLSEAYLGRAALYRWNPDNTTTLIPIDLSKAMEGDMGQNLPLMKWDTLEIFSQQEAAFVGTRKVEVRGVVQRPGIYEYSQNMRVSDILLRAGGALPNAERIELIHQHGDGTYGLDSVLVADVAHGDKARDLTIQDNDLVAVYSNRQAAFQADHLVRIEGNVVTPGFYPRAEAMRLTDLLRISGGFRPGASPRVVIAHARRPVDSPDNANKIVQVMFNSNNQCAPQDDARLEDGDVIAVQGTGGIEERPAVVRIIGAVNKPGPIILKNKNQRLSDAIAEAGGLRDEAFPEGAEFNRDPTTLNSKTQRDLAVVIGQLNNLLNDSNYKAQLAKSDIERLKALNTASSDTILPTPGAAASNSAAAVSGATELFKHDLVTTPRRLTDKELDPSGNIAINLPAALDEAKRHTTGVDDILLKDGDTIIVPEKPTTIQVIGAVTNQRGILYSPGKNLNFYVAQAGDFTPDAAKDRIVVIHAGGGIIPAKNARELRPGDVILVPTKVLAEKISENRNGFGDFFKSLTSSAILFKLATGVFGI